MLTKFTPTTLPTSQNSIHPVRVVNGQTATIAKTFPMAQLTSIVIATPGTRLAGPQTVQLSKPSLEKQVWAECLHACCGSSLGFEAIAARHFLSMPCQGFFISAPNQHPIALLYDNSFTSKSCFSRRKLGCFPRLQRLVWVSSPCWLWCRNSQLGSLPQWGSLSLLNPSSPNPTPETESTGVDLTVEVSRGQ